MGKMFNNNINADHINNLVDIPNHNGTTQGLKLGGTLVTATGAELNLLDDRGATVTTAAVVGTTNQTIVTFTVKDASGNALARLAVLDIFLSDSATGVGLTAVTASGTVANDATTGSDLATLATKKMLRVQTNTSGLYKLAITDTSKTQFYPCAVLGDKVIVGTRVLTASYG